MLVVDDENFASSLTARLELKGVNARAELNLKVSLLEDARKDTRNKIKKG